MITYRKAAAIGAVAYLSALASFGMAKADQPMPGQALAFDRAKGNCLACHTIKGGDVSSTVGPELSGIKARFPNKKDLVEIIANEEARNPQTVMPLFGKNYILTDKEIDEVADFVHSL
jgi:sulfur-oxidizing protein SoxX